jgi:hypothetical protein
MKRPSTYFQESIMNAATLELPLLQNRVNASAVNTLLERREPPRRPYDQVVSQLLDEPVEPVTSWLDSGCPRSKQSRSTHQAAALLFPLGIVLTAGLAVTFENSRALVIAAVSRIAEIL